MTRKYKSTKRQFGFFDLGISLAILAITGGVALSTNHIQDKKIAAQQDSVTMEANLQSSSMKTASATSEKSDQDFQ